MGPFMIKLLNNQEFRNRIKRTGGQFLRNNGVCAQRSFRKRFKSAYDYFKLKWRFYTREALDDELPFSLWAKKKLSFYKSLD